jgi:DNA-binding transcriptional LysR family regulator
MTPRQLEFVVIIEELGSISACAEHMGVSQSAVTNQILQLGEFS